MTMNKSGIFWGVILIGAGVLALLERAGLTGRFQSQVWMAVFAIVSLLAFATFAMSGWKTWPWLFPAGIFGGLAVIVALSIAGVNNSAMGAPLFFGLLLPFAAAYLLDRKANWWALIPGGIMLFLALVTLLADSAPGEWIGALVLFMGALAFLSVYLTDRKRWWALIPAYTLGLLGIAPLASMNGRSADWFGPVFLLGLALPFLFVFFRWPERWWAFIPGGVLTVVGIVAALDIWGVIDTNGQEKLTGALVLGGMAVVFGVVWLRTRRPWAAIAAGILALVGVVSMFTGRTAEILVPLIVILAGGVLLYTAIRPRKA